MPAKETKLQSNIRSISTSVYVVGGYHAFMLAFGLMVILFSGVHNELGYAQLSIATSLFIAVFWFISAYKMRNRIKQPREALKIIALVMYVSLAYLAYLLYETVIYGVSTGLIIMAVFTAYMLWSYMDIRDRINGKK